MRPSRAILLAVVARDDLNLAFICCPSFPPHRYRSTTNVNLPFKVHPIVEELGKTRVEYTIQVRTTFSPKLAASNVVIKIPTPLNTAKVECKVTLGKAKYVPSDNMIVWK